MDNFDLNDLIERAEKLYNDIDDILIKQSKIYAMNAKALAQNVIQERGIGFNYSTVKKTPVHLLYGSALNNKGKKFIKDKLKEKNTKNHYSNWAEFRSAQGLQNTFVDLTYTGKMFNGMIPGQTEIRGNYFYTPIQHNNKEGAEKMYYNFERYGDFFNEALQGETGEKLALALKTDLENEFKKYFE